MLKSLTLGALAGLVLFGCASAPAGKLDLTQPATIHKTGGPVYNLAWGADGRIASASREGVKVWNPAEATITTLPGHRGFVWGLAWSPDQTHLASDGWDGLVNVWNSRTSALEKSFSSEGLGLWSLAWSPDGSRLAVGADRGLVKVYSLATGDEQDFATGGPSPVVSLAWSPGGAALVVGDTEGNLAIWSTSTWQVTKTFTVESDRMRYDVNGAVWSPDGRWFATSHQDGALRVWDPNRETAVATYQQQKGWVRALAWAPDSRTLVVGGEDGTLSVWDFPTRSVRLTLAESPLPFWSVAWSPDGLALAGGTGVYTDADQGEVLVWSSAPPSPRP